MTGGRWKIAAGLGLLAFCAAVQAVSVRRTMVPEMDTIRFVDEARRIQSLGLLPAVRTMVDQPAYPLSIWLVQQGVGDFPGSWARSAQLAAVIPLVLAVVPMLLLLSRQVGWQAALAGTLLFCLLPKVSRLGADALSDPAQLLFFAGAAAAIVAYWDSPRRPGWLFAAGLLVAIGSLARAEILVLPMAVVIALAAFQCRPSWRRPWREPILGLAALSAGLALVLVPYLLATDSLAPRAALARVLGRPESVELASPTLGAPGRQLPLRDCRLSLRESSEARRPTAGRDAAFTERRETEPAGTWRLDDGHAMVFPRKERSESLRRHGWAVAKIWLEELAAAFGYWPAVFVLLGLASVWRSRVRPLDRFGVIFAVLYAAATAVFAVREGYVTARHFLPLVVFGIGCGGHALLETGRRLGRRLSGRWPGLAPVPTSGWAWGLVLLGAVALAPGLLRPQRVHRLADLHAARWLAADRTPSGLVLDTQGVTGLYSGRPTRWYEHAQAAFADPDLAFVVVRADELNRDSDRSRTLQALLERAAEPVAAFDNPRTNCPGHSVLVYRWHPERLAGPCRADSAGGPDRSLSGSRSDKRRSGLR